MSAAIRDAQRKQAVRETAAAWQKAGAIDEPTRRSIDVLYPDERGRLSPVFRALAGGFSGLAVLGFLGMVFLTRPPERPTAILFGLFLVGATEIQIGPLRRSQGGIETVTGLLGILFVTAGIVADQGSSTVLLALGTAAALFAVACIRWEGSLWAIGLSLSVLGLSAQTPYPRISWLLVGLLLTAPLLRFGESPMLSPGERGGCRAAAVVLVLAVYASVHLGSFDHHFVEDLHDASPRPAPDVWFRPWCIAGTALLPVILVLLGVFRRRKLLLNLGVLLAVASLATLRFYVHAVPLWVAMTAAGAAAMGIALLTRRFLDSGPEKEFGGLTAEALFDSSRGHAALEIVASAALAGKPRTVDHPPDFKGGGGQSGGGGASDSY
jgi:hypothetical protein